MAACQRSQQKIRNLLGTSLVAGSPRNMRRCTSKYPSLTACFVSHDQRNQASNSAFIVSACARVLKRSSLKRFMSFMARTTPRLAELLQLGLRLFRFESLETCVCERYVSSVDLDRHKRYRCCVSAFGGQQTGLAFRPCAALYGSRLL